LRALASNEMPSGVADVFGVARFPWNLQADAQLVDSVRRSRNVIVVEEHYRDGGMGESLKLALPDVTSFQVLSAAYSPSQRYGSAAFHMKQCGLTPEALLAAVHQALEKGH
jgi:transketolase C-terminal domain/subunit